MQRELKTVITGNLLVVILLATVLTYAILMVFWLRTATLSFSREKEAVLLACLEHINFSVSQSQQIGARWPSLLPEIMQRTGAVAGCVPGERNVLSCNGIQTGDGQTLTNLITAVQRSGEKKRALSGTLWLGMIPGKQFLDLALPVHSPQQGAGVVSLRFSLEPVFSAIGAEQRYIGLYLLVNLLVLAVVGFFRFRQGIIRPVEQLVRLTDSYSDEHGVPFLALEGGNQLAQLARSMQQMLGRIRSDREQLRQHVATLEETNKQLIRTREEMIRAEKLTSVGRLAAGLAHEIGNPAGIVQGYLGLLQRQDLTGQERKDFCSRAEQEMQRIIRLVRQLLDLAKPTNSVCELLDIHQVVNEVLALLQPQPLMDGIKLTARLEASDSMMQGNPSQLLQVFLNCLINAADSINSLEKCGRGSIEIITTTLIVDAQQHIRVRIIDNGSGADQETIANAFDPFFTTKEPGKGTGLGLSVTHAIIFSMQGSIKLANREQSGAMVEIILPVFGKRNSIGQDTSNELEKLH